MPRITPPAMVEVCRVKADEDMVLIRKKVRDAAVSCGMSLIDQTKLVTAASELARNTLKYGFGGEMHLEILHDDLRKGVRLRFIDQGPGIADIDLALTDGYTTGKGMGLGLGGARRLTDEFELDSKPGQGTTVTITKWKR